MYSLRAFLIFLLGLSPTFSLGELMPLGSAESEGLYEVSGTPLRRTKEISSKGDYAYELTERRTYTLEPLIPIDPSKTYRLSAAFRSAEKEKPASANFGLAMYDEQKRYIGICHISPIEGTDTLLLKPLKPGETEVWIEDGGHWKSPSKHHRIAFQTEEDFADLPNFNLSSQVEALVETPQGWKASLESPAERAYPAGTPVRQHVAWGAGLYWVANDWVPSEWTPYSTTLTGIHPKGTTMDHFWKGTRYVRIIVRLGNWDRIPKEGARLLVDEISFRTIDSLAGQ